MPSDKSLAIKRVIRRVGLGFGPWRGIDKESDRGAVAPDQFVELVNLRLSGGRWGVRGGLGPPINSTALEGCVTGLIDMGGDPVLTSFLVNGAREGAYGSDDVLTAINVISDTPTLTPLNMTSVMPYAGATAETTVTPRRVITLFDNAPYFIDSSTGLSKLTLPDEPDANLTDDRVITRIVPTLNLGGNANYATTAFGKIWVIDVTGVLVSWDGSTLVEVEDTFGAGANLVCGYRENIYVVTPSALYKQNSSGTWTTIALPALPGTFHPRCIAECPTVDKLYFGGIVEDGSIPQPYLFAYDGTSVTTAFTAAGESYTPIEFYHGVTDVVEWNGVATFTWFDEDTETALAYIGTVASPTAVQIGGATTARPAATALLVDSDETLYASINPAYDAGNVNRVLRRDGTSLGGSWTSDATGTGWTSMGEFGTGGTNEPPMQMFSFL